MSKSPELQAIEAIDAQGFARTCQGPQVHYTPTLWAARHIATHHPVLMGRFLNGWHYGWMLGIINAQALTKGQA